MKYKSKIVVFIMLVIVLIIIFISTSYKTSKYLLVNLITKDEMSDEIEYIAVYPNKDSKKIDKFVSDDFQTYNADHGCFTSYIDNNKVFNKLNKIALEESLGNDADEEIIKRIFQVASKLEHDIWQFQIFRVDDKYFALVKLNVNWQSPCDFYEFDKTNGSLNLLKRFEGVDIIGISLPREE